MKVYQFDLRVVVPDDASEDEILERARAIAEDFSGGALVAPGGGQSQAKAVLVGVEPCGTDPEDCLVWDTQACEAISKTSPIDWFWDSRVVGTEDGGAG